MMNDTIRVLVIDDDEVDRANVRRCLANEGTLSKVDESHSLEDSIAWLDEHDVDVVLLDLGLGLTTGLDTLREFRRRAPEIPVLVLSGVENVEMAIQAIQEGAQDFIKKEGLGDRWLTIALQNGIRRHQIQQKLVSSMTELKMANDDLRQFSYIISHDLQEPLRAIGGYTQLLQKATKDTLQDQEVAYANNIVEGVQRMQHLIEDLLLYSQSGFNTKYRADIDLNLCMQEACQNLHAAISTSKASVAWSSLPTVRGNRGQLVQLFQNLIGNAVKYYAPGAQPAVEITASQTAETTRISVADNGIGIDVQYQDKIFQLFKRLHHRSEYPGTGAGLAICRRIAQSHGGTLSVESAFGSGSTFTVCLPGS